MLSVLYMLWLRSDEGRPSLPSFLVSVGSRSPIHSPYWWNADSSPKGDSHVIFLIENYNRTNVKEIVIPRGLNVTEFKNIASSHINTPYSVTWYSASKSVSYLHNSIKSIDSIIEESNRFVWTKPNEIYRKVNGAFVYLWTSEQAKPSKDGNYDKRGMMKESVESLVKHFSVYGPYPVIIFHELPQDVRDNVEAWFNRSTIIHWVSVADQFPYQRLPDLPLLREKNLTGPGIKGVHTPCSNRVWPTGYLQMIRFRVLGTWEQDILRYFDYIQQIDTDITIVRSEFDPFIQTANLDAVLGFYHCEIDRSCAIGMHEWMLKYAEKNNLEWRFLDNIYPELVYSVNFATLNTKFFMNNPKIMQLFRAYVATGFIETLRWTEQILYPYVLALFTDYDRIYVYGNHVAITHYRKEYPPRLECIRKPFFCCK